MPAWFYILRLLSGKLYVGSTRNFERRIRNHFARRGSRTTRFDPPRELAYWEEFSGYREAFRRERQVKGWTKAKKEALIRGDITALKQLARRKH